MFPACILDSNDNTNHAWTISFVNQKCKIIFWRHIGSFKQAFETNFGLCF